MEKLVDFIEMVRSNYENTLHSGWDVGANSSEEPVRRLPEVKENQLSLLGGGRDDQNS